MNESEIVKMLRVPVAHDECEDRWFSCPKSSEGCANPGEGPDCTCGADRLNALHAAAADALEKAAQHGYQEFFDEVCRRAEQAMMKSHRLEGMHYMAMKQVRDEWDAINKERT